MLMTAGKEAVGTVMGIAVVTFDTPDGGLVVGVLVVGVTGAPHIYHDGNIVTLYVCAWQTTCTDWLAFPFETVVNGTFRNQ